VPPTAASVAPAPAESPWGPVAPQFGYLAGPAGSGKTFATKAWAASERGLELCATTGIAAINLGGTTINALLGFFDTKSLEESFTTGHLEARLGRLWRAGVRRIVLDEVSMLDGAQLGILVQAIEAVNSRKYVLDSDGVLDEETAPPALGLTLVGDFLQLPPVKGSFAFQNPAWDRFAGHVVTLTEIRRQADQDFIQALRAARRGEAAGVLDYFGARLQQETDDAFPGPTLLAKNESVDRYNWLRMGKLTGREVLFENRRQGKQRSEWGSPDKPPHTWGIPPRLLLKIGCLVMILANTRDEFGQLRYVNGDLGEVVDATATTALVVLHRTGEVVEVAYCRREVKVPCDAARRKELKESRQLEKLSEDGKWEITGWVEYLPLRVAYASTVHKSQGLSLDEVQVNVRDGFFRTPGMLYVALSRARTAAGLRIVGSLAMLRERCLVDPRLGEWL
jgi:hypothetical protein